MEVQDQMEIQGLYQKHSSQDVFKEVMQKYIAWGVATINIIGVLLALILATRNVFFKKK